MSELNLPACPICHAPESLVPATRTIQGETYTWHECRRCGSVLLFVGNGRWAYQKIGLDAQAHLLKKPLTAGELSALLPAAQPPPRVSPAVPARGEEPERRQAQAPAPVSTQRPASVSAPPAAGKPAPRLFGVAAALLALAAILAVAGVGARLLREKRPPAATPTTSQAPHTSVALADTRAAEPTATSMPTATPTALRPTATWVPTLTPIPPTPTPTPDPRFEKELDAVEAEVARIRGLGEPRPISRIFLTRPELLAHVEEWVETQYEPEELEREVRAMAAFGFLPRNYDLGRALVAFYSSQVAGYYDHEADTLYVISSVRDGKLPPLEQAAFAHEYGHGLDDQRFDLDTFLDAEQLNEDEYLARQALVEGSATVLMSEYFSTLYLTDEEVWDIVMQILYSGGEALSSMPSGIVSTMEFPYTEGASFVSSLYEDGGWEAVNAAFADPPRSTEQVLHPRKYLAREEPIDVPLPSLADTLGTGWSLVKTDTLGQQQISLYLDLILYDDAALSASEGWGGDRYALYANGDDEVLVLAAAWDSVDDRDEFVRAYKRFAETKYRELASGTEDARVWWDLERQAAVLTWRDTRTVLVTAPDLDTANRVVEAMQ